MQQHFDHEGAEQKTRQTREKQAEREQRTYQMHQVWISPDLYNLRSEAWEFLRDCLRSAEQKPIFLGAYRDSPDTEERRLHNVMGGVSHFMADMNVLLDAGLLDEQLVWRLCGRTLLYWIKLYEQVDFRADADDASDDSRTAAEWYRREIRPLATRLRQYQLAASVAEQMGLPGPSG